MEEQNEGPEQMFMATTMMLHEKDLLVTTNREAWPLINQLLGLHHATPDALDVHMRYVAIRPVELPDLMFPGIQVLVKKPIWENFTILFFLDSFRAISGMLDEEGQFVIVPDQERLNAVDFIAGAHYGGLSVPMPPDLPDFLKQLAAASA